jgi:hypothetical protein
MMALTAPETGAPVIRPLPGLHFISDGVTVTTCLDPADQAAACKTSTERLRALRVIGRDIFGGAQHALRRLEPTPAFRAAASAEARDELAPRL